jgi:peptidoglycan/xylan/chitin deacetylase (PgdA/CDA1 family)
MKEFFFALLHATRVTQLSAWWYRKRVIFLCYHGVTQRPTRSPEDPKGLHVNARRFEKQLDFLCGRYRVIPLCDYVKAQLQGDSLPKYSVVLTFDDGFRNFLTAAAPLLAARRMPATVFLITDKAGEKSNEQRTLSWTSEDDQSYLSWEDARMLKRTQDIEFGSHTCSHSGLLTLSAADSRRELQHSYNDLVNQLMVEMPALSYPKGQYSRLLADAAREVGYACAVTTDRGPNELHHDLFTLGRTLIGDDDDEASFAVRVSGLRWSLVKALGFLRAPRVTPPNRETVMQPESPADRYPEGEVYQVPR